MLCLSRDGMDIQLSFGFGWTFCFLRTYIFWYVENEWSMTDDIPYPYNPGKNTLSSSTGDPKFRKCYPHMQLYEVLSRVGKSCYDQSF